MEKNIRKGYLLGLLAVVIFAMTLPMTRLAVGDPALPQLAPAFVTAGRAALAGLLSLAYLRIVGASRPTRAALPALLVCAAGTVVGFPLGLALALRDVESMHAAIVTGILPLATAVLGALSTRQRPSAGFWLCALTGAALVLGFAMWQGAGRLVPADAWLVFAMLCAAVGYVAGARAAATMPPQQVICWVLVACLPFTLPTMAWWWPEQGGAAVRWSAWLGFGYAALFSMWLGFFAWYRGLVLGGVVRVSQVQLLQPFLALLFAVPLLGERLDPATIGFAILIAAVVLAGRRMPIRRTTETSRLTSSR